MAPSASAGSGTRGAGSRRCGSVGPGQGEQETSRVVMVRKCGTGQGPMLTFEAVEGDGTRVKER